MEDLFYMQKALEQAKLAEQFGEVPVGAVLVKNNEIIASSYNSCIKDNDPSSHAEINVLRAAAKKMHNYRLIDTTLYVTLEPCLMCAGAMLHGRIKKLVFACSDPKTGAFGGAINIYKNNQWNHKIIVKNNILQQDCSLLIKNFFKNKR